MKQLRHLHNTRACTTKCASHVCAWCVRTRVVIARLRHGERPGKPRDGSAEGQSGNVYPREEEEKGGRKPENFNEA